MNVNMWTSDDSVFHGQALDIILVVNANLAAKRTTKSECPPVPTRTVTQQPTCTQTPSATDSSTTTSTRTGTKEQDNQSDVHTNRATSNNVLSLGSNNPIPIACNDFNVCFPGRKGIVRVHLNGIYIDGLDMISSAKDECRFVHDHSKKPSPRGLQNLQSYLSQFSQQGHLIRFHLVDSERSSVVLGVAEATIFLWQSTDHIVACDIDGTITKSNVRGAWDTIVTERYDHVHPGVAGFLQSLQQQQHQHQHQLRIVYLTSRPMSLVTSTRKFLQTYEQQQQQQQQQQHQYDEVHNGTVLPTTTTTTPTSSSITTTRLPAGPVFCNLLDLGSVLMSELLWKDVYCYKRDVLINQVLLPFQIVHDDSSLSSTSLATTKQQQQQQQHEPQTTLVMGFGNTTFDTMAYEMAGIPLQCIYQINERGMIKCHDKSHAPAMDSYGRHPSKDYSCFAGSTFQGYADPNLLDDVQRKLDQSC